MIVKQRLGKTDDDDFDSTVYIPSQPSSHFIIIFP